MVAVDPNLTLILPQFDQTFMTTQRRRRIFLHNATEEPIPPERIADLKGTILPIHTHSSMGKVPDEEPA